MEAAQAIGVTDATNMISLVHTTFETHELAIKRRVVQALASGGGSYPIHRSMHFAAKIGLTELFDRLAIELGWHAHRIDATEMLLDGGSLLASVTGTRKRDYSSCYIGIWASTARVAESAQALIQSHVAEFEIDHASMFSLNWHFMTGKGELRGVRMEELADDVLYDEAYPYLPGGVRQFIAQYLNATEAVLVLQGPPGTGKTRLIRAVLGEISRRKDGPAEAMYTGDQKAIESDELFVRFITGEEDAFVVEDADHLLKPRAGGNENLHRFLTIADGVARSQGRKIIFSTNLPNIGDLDDALLRPGRCFAHIPLRDLSPDEAKRLLSKLRVAHFGYGVVLPGESLPNLPKQRYSLAEIYRAAQPVT